MRQTILTFLAAFAGVLLALSVFDAYKTRAEARERAAADADQQARVEQGRKLAEQALAQLKADEAIRSDAMVMSTARLAVTETYFSRGRMPSNNVEAGLPVPETFKGRSLKSLQVQDGGRIVLTFDAASGVDGGTISLEPDLAGLESMGIQWRCQASDYPQIARVLPGCVAAAPTDSANEILANPQ